MEQERRGDHLDNTVRFRLHDMLFEYDEEKNRTNIEKHGISLKTAALVFLDYNRIEYYDETHSDDEDRYNTIGVARPEQYLTVETGRKEAVLFVVYTEREIYSLEGQQLEITRIISARKATGFEKGLYYGKYN